MNKIKLSMTGSFLMIFYFIIVNSIFAQEFEVSDLTSNKFSIDLFTEDIYIKEFWSGDIYVTNLKTGITELSRFPTLPAFANKTHLAAYVDNRKVYFYEFEKDSTYLFLDSTGRRAAILFSPNDSAVIINEWYYDLHSAKKYSINYNLHSWIKWSSDTTIIRTGYKGNIFNHFIKSGRMDTLIILDDVLQNDPYLGGYDYNSSK